MILMKREEVLLHLINISGTIYYCINAKRLTKVDKEYLSLFGISQYRRFEAQALSLI